MDHLVAGAAGGDQVRGGGWRSTVPAAMLGREGEWEEAHLGAVLTLNTVGAVDGGGGGWSCRNRPGERRPRR